jgi:hypothetical protein
VSAIQKMAGSRGPASRAWLRSRTLRCRKSALGAGSRRGAAWLTSVRPRRADLKSDILAALPGAISSVGDGIAASVLAGVKPVHGL